MRKMKLSLIANKRSKKKTFMRRKRGMMKKLHELTTLCGVQACAVICSPYQSVPELWPSKEIVKEVASKFMEMPMIARTKKMVNQETYMQERIAKEQEKVNNMVIENRELEVRQFMFDCVEGKMAEYRYDARDLHDLQCFIQNYINFLTRRIEIFIENGESSLFPPFPGVVYVADPPVVANVTSFVAADAAPVAADAAAVAARSGYNDHIQYQNMNMNQNQQEPIQHHVPIHFCDSFQNQKMNMDQNRHELVQCKAPSDLYDQIQHGIYNMNLNQDMNLDSNDNLNLNLNLNSNQYMNQQQSSMDLMLEQQIGYARGDTKIPFMDGNNCNYYLLPTAGIATTSHMPSTTTTNGVYPPYISNNL